MGLLPEGEILRTARRYSLILITVGALFLIVGIWAARTMHTRGDAGVFLYLWSSIWFLGTGAALYSGLSGWFKPPVYAILNETGIAFPTLRVPCVPWSHILSARLAPKTITDSEGTTHVFTAPLILHLRDLGPLADGAAARWTQGQTAALPDGTIEWMIQTHTCPLPASEFLARIQTRLDPARAPDLQPAATFGGQPLNPPAAPKSFLRRFHPGGIISVITGVFVLSAAYNSWSIAQQGKTWRKTSATVESAEVVRHVSKRRHNTTWRIQLAYRFTVSGQAFHGVDTHYRYNDGVRSFVEGKLKDFPPGAPVAIYYDPRDPSASSFLPPTRDNAAVLLVVGGFFLTFGIIIIAIPRLTNSAFRPAPFRAPA
jgi:hypothetical protein